MPGITYLPHLVDHEASVESLDTGEDVLDAITLIFNLPVFPMNQTPLDQLLKDLRFTSVYNKKDGG